ncbi:hypothetical protein ASG11_06830 [Sphingomonas sp. Leaf357]|uniref:hypothetical protein n=1 Tax=Sphingomonas sp. Leaf357 TaxID=1736350 RepID=UPI0006F46ACC|nr:hypothetical protein [Sphingomonas sp. Leaf357]KQS04000.1 hypothetical protein ASG11_06830 [Sphingomonas sp. Leaf357]
MTDADPRDDRDIPPDNGERPTFSTSIRKGLGDVGTGDGYSGQEYDSAGQSAWRAEQQRRNLPKNGGVAGSGIGAGGGQKGEDYDVDSPAGAEPDG